MTHLKLLVCDLDNTLYDWVEYFVASFYAMVDAAVMHTGCDRDTLLDDFQKVHQKHHDSEHPFSLLETDTIKKLYAGKSRREIAKELNEVFHAFNSMRKKMLHVHPYVHDTLKTLSTNGVSIVAHSESKMHAVVDRLRRLQLTDHFARIYCQQRTEIEHPYLDKPSDWLADFPIDKIVELSHHQRKPDVSVLSEICFHFGIPPENTAYVGDSIAKDILMARDAGVFAIWAAYGANHDSDAYQKLVRISHWTAEDVKYEKKLAQAAAQVKPNFIARKSFAEVLNPFGLSDEYLRPIATDRMA